MEEQLTTERGAKGCFKIGCFGCLGCLGVTILTGLVLAVIGASMGVPEADPVDQVFSREVPRPGAPTASPPAAEPAELQGERFGLTPGDLAGRPPGRLILDLSVGEFTIMPGPAGEPLRVEARYDRGSFELEESFETAEDSSWTYRVKFGTGISWIRHAFGNLNESLNKVRIIVPRDTAFSLEGRVGIGESRFELGGLWLTDVQLETGIGEHTFDFDEPLPRPIEEFRVKGSIGEVTVSNLGNASPGNVSVRKGIGELTLDLRGDWQRDASILATQSIGELQVLVPKEGVAVELERAGVTIGEHSVWGLQDRPMAEAGQPTLRLHASLFIGELRVDD